MACPAVRGKRLVDQGHEVHVAYQTSGNIAVFDDDAIRYAEFVAEFNNHFDVSPQRTAELEAHARRAGVRTVRLETNRSLAEAISLYRRSGYREVAAFNEEPYAHHWFEKRLAGPAHVTRAGGR